MNFAKRRFLVNAFFYSQFNYCQLLWMCHNWTNNNKINHLLERCIHLIYNNSKSSFENLLEKGGSVSIHHRNLRTVAVELFIIFKGLSPVIFAEGNFAVRCAKTVKNGLESLSYIDPKLWDSIPSHMKERDSFNKAQQVIKTWKPDLCSCRLCKTYLENTGYL